MYKERKTKEKLCRGEIDTSTMVHDEEAGVSIKLGMLLRQPLNAAKLTAAEISERWAMRQSYGPDEKPAEPIANDSSSPGLFIA